MNLSLAAVPLAIATLDWIGVAKNRKNLRYIAKPGVILALLALLGVFTGFQGATRLTAIGLAFSLAGDIALILPKEQFKSAILFFSLAIISYIAAFNRGSPPALLPSLLILTGMAFLTFRVFSTISKGLIKSGFSKLRGPILIYMLLITGMGISALLTLLRPPWPLSAAVFTSIGGLLFLYSDSTLAWNRFVKPLPNGRLKVIISYHVAQIAIVIGAILNFQAS